MKRIFKLQTALLLRPITNVFKNVKIKQKKGGATRMSPSNSLKGNRTKLDLINGVWRGFCHKQSALCSSFQCYNSWSAAAIHVQTKTMNSVWYVSQFKTNDGEFLRSFFSFFWNRFNNLQSSSHFPSFYLRECF